MAEELSPEAKRKQAQREREAAMGIERREIKLSASEAASADFACSARAVQSEPYEFNEYVATLIRRDRERLDRQLEKLSAQVCGQCGKALPSGCRGAFIGELPCWQTKGLRTLQL